MTVSFNGIPNTLRVPIFAVEFDNSNAMGAGVNQVYRTLAFGQKLSSGKGETMKPYRVSDKQDAINLFGSGSMLAEIVDYYRRTDSVTELVAIAVPEVEGGSKATGSIAFAGTPTESGALYCYINGQRFTVSVKTGDTAEAIHTAVANQINTLNALPVYAYGETDKVTLEARHTGNVMADIDIRLNYYTGEYLPSGLSAKVVPFTGGGANPDLTDAFDLIKGEWFNGIINPYSDANNLYVIKQELEDRWGPLVMREGFNFFSRRGTFGELCDFGSERNSQLECVLHCTGIPNSPWAVAASLAANAMYYGNIDQARPFQTLPLVGILPPVMEDRFSEIPQSNQLLYNGISNFYVDSDTVRLGRLITTYHRSSSGADDESYLDLNTPLTLGYLRYSLRNYFMRKFPRFKLADDGILYDSGQCIMTPKLAKAACINWFDEMAKRGLVENKSQFKSELIVERNTAQRNRLDFRLPPDLVNQFIVGAAQIQFIL